MDERNPVSRRSFSVDGRKVNSHFSVFFVDLSSMLGVFQGSCARDGFSDIRVEKRN